MSAPASRVSLATLYFFTALPMGMWTVPLSSIFKAHGRENLIPWVLATTGLAAFISPLFIGALADQKVPPIRLLRWLTVATAAAIALTATSLALHWPDAAVLALSQMQALIYMPVFGVATSIVLAELQDAGKQFGPLRAFATLGWMCAGVLVSFVLQGDDSLVTTYTAAACWLGVSALTWTLPELKPTDVQEHRTWWQILGLDALTLLRHRDHRVVFITAALYSIPLAAFYPYTMLQLRDLGVARPTAVMSLAQITEVIVMFGLAAILARARLKWIFFFGILLGVIRYGFAAIGTPAWVITSIVMHGLAYTLYFITTQVYLEDRIEPRWRVRAQALLTLLTGGVGNLAGYLGGGWWHHASKSEAGSDWHRFWLGETAAVAAVCVFFVLAYRGKKAIQ
jgi:MFS family permease